MNYEELCQWRDICEFLFQQSYRFIDREDYPKHFTLLFPEGKPHRQALWDAYKIQLIRYGGYPALNYRRGERGERQLVGWRLLPEWESKIDFLERVYVLDRDPESLPKPWVEKLQAWLKSLKCPLGFDCSSMMQAIGMDAYECPNLNTCRGMR